MRVGACGHFFGALTPADTASAIKAAGDQGQTQPGTWAQLLPEQRRRLTSLGITPAEPSSPARSQPRGQRAEPGAAGVPARRNSPRPVDRAGRRPAGPPQPHRANHGRRRDGRREARRMEIKHPIENRQAHRRTASGAAGGGRRLGITEGRPRRGGVRPGWRSAPGGRRCASSSTMAGLLRRRSGGPTVGIPRPPGEQRAGLPA